MAKLKAALLFLALAANVQADWAIHSSESEQGQAGVVHRRIVLEDASAGGRAIIDLAIFSTKSCSLRVIDNTAGESLSDVMAGNKCVAGVNGGYFSPEFAPVGLLICDGKMLAPLQHARLITGILGISPRGVEILRAGEYSRQRKMVAAVQCGPFLVDHYQSVRGLNDSQSARRTFAAITRDERALMGVSSEVSLAQLATILATTQLAGDLKIQRALNLDGGSSSAFWVARENGSAFSIAGLKLVRDFVAIVPK